MASSIDLLSLSQAASLLNVHPATLRRWADQGDVLVVVTPGGHRRFPRSEIDRLMGIGEHVEDEEELARHIVDRALIATREQIPGQREQAWMAGFNATEREHKRQTGQRLMSLLGEVLAADDDGLQPLLSEVQGIGRSYAEDGRRHEMDLSSLLRAIMFFRDRIVDSTLTEMEESQVDSAARRRAIQRINIFSNAILLSVADAFGG